MLGIYSATYNIIRGTGIYSTKTFPYGVEGTVRQIVSPELICDDCQRRADVRSPDESKGAESVFLMETFI
jgi:hypothetical protein